MAEHTIAPEKEEEEEVELLYDQYTFSCSCNGTESGESDLLKVNPPGVSIHFMRYGLAKKDFTDVFLYPKDKEPTWQAVDGAPYFTYYKYVRTSLREGWIFIYNECTGKMKRYETDAPVGPYLLQKDDTIWVAYSEVNWCQEYSDAMCSDADKRSKRMQKISWDDWYNKQQIEHGICAEKVDGIFYTNHEAYNFGHQHQSALANEEDPDKKENLFFCLHDPMGIAYQLTYELQHQWNLMDALLISVKLGVPRDEVLKCLQEGGDPECLQTPEQEPEQITALFNIASTLRSIAFASDESREKMGDHLDAERLAAVLATEERHLQQQQIQEARNHLKQYLEQPYYLDILADYKENGDEEIQNCWFFTAKDFLSLLAPMPNSKDGFMDTPEESKKWNADTDTCQKFIFDVLSRKNDLGKLFDEKTIFEIIEDHAHYMKLVGIFDTLMDVAVALPAYSDKILGVMEQVFNRFTIRTVDGTLDGLVKMEAFGLSLKHHNNLSQEVKQMLNFTPEALAVFMDKNLTYLIKYEEWMEVKQLRFTDKFEDAILRNEKLKAIEGFQSSHLWAKFLRNVGGLNFVVAGFAIRKSSNKMEFTLNAAKFITATADVIAAHRGVSQLVMQTQEVNKITLASFRGRTESIVKGVSYASVVIDTAETAYNFWQRDYDAAAAYAGSAILTGVSIYAFSAATGAAAAAAAAGVINIWNPVGWACLIVAAGFAIWAVSLEDDPFEQYAKHCIFRKLKNSWHLYLPQGVLTAPVKVLKMAVDTVFYSEENFSGNYINQIKQHIERRDFLGDSNGWNDYKKGFKALLDLLFTGRIILESGTKIVHEKKERYIGKFSSVSETTYIATSMTAKIIFSKGITNKNDLKYKIFFFPEGINRGGYEELDKTGDSCINLNLEFEDDQPPKAVISFSISAAFRKALDKNAEIVFMCRLKTGKSYSVPTIAEDGKERYLASRLGIFLTDQSSSFSNNISQENYSPIKVGTEESILNGNDSWWPF